MSKIRYFVAAVLFVSLSGCNAVLRQPQFELEETESKPAQVVYEVMGYDVTPKIVEGANQSRFMRLVNVGTNSHLPVRRVSESSVFGGQKPKANVRSPYKLGAGDVLSVTRTGFLTNERGFETRGVSATTYTVSERGSVDLNEGRSVAVDGLTVAQARQAIENALGSFGADSSASFQEATFPVSPRPVYRLGTGDVIRISRLIDTTDANGSLTQKIETSQSTVGADGVVSLLQLGEIQVAGLTIPQVRDTIVREATRNALGVDTVIEIQNFSSQSVFISGDLGTRLVTLTDQPLSYDRLIASLGPVFEGDRDYVIELERTGVRYQMLASAILLKNSRDSFPVFDGDRIIVRETLPTSKVRVDVTRFASRSLTYLRVVALDTAGVQRGVEVPIGIKGLDLRTLLISQGLDVNHNRDRLIQLHRGNSTFKLSAQSVVLNNPGKRYWLEPDDHVVVEDIAYVGDSALLVGELRAPRRLPIDRHTRTTLSQALFDGGVFSAADADFKHVYVLRGEGLKFDAYHFDITQVLNLSLAEDFELRPGDIMFVRTRPLTRYNRALALALTFVNAVDTGLTNARTFGR